MTGARADRLVGVDVARCLALLGMVATHVLLGQEPDGSLTDSQWLAGGRAAALFAVLAGVSIALMTGRRTPVRGRERDGAAWSWRSARCWSPSSVSPWASSRPGSP